jgi:hypothetical protein
MKQGEIWQIDLDPAIGAEIKKARPALIISDDHKKWPDYRIRSRLFSNTFCFH